MVYEGLQVHNTDPSLCLRAGQIGHALAKPSLHSTPWACIGLYCNKRYNADHIARFLFISSASRAVALTSLSSAATAKTPQKQQQYYHQQHYCHHHQQHHQ